MGLTLLAQHKSGRDTSAVMSALANLIPFVKSNLTAETLSRMQKVVISSMSGSKISELKFTWDNLNRNSFNLLLFINLVSETIYSNETDNNSIIGYEGKGCLHLLPEGNIRLYPEMNIAKSQKTPSERHISVDDKIGVYLAADNTALPTDFQENYRFYNVIIDSQMQVKPSPRKAIKIYEPGDVLKVKVVEIDDRKHLYPPRVVVESIDPDYEPVRGNLFIKFKDKDRPAFPNIIDCLKVNEDIFMATYKVVGQAIMFDITPDFEDAYRRIASEKAGNTVPAIYNGEYKNGYKLLTADGVRVGMENTWLDELPESTRSEFVDTLESDGIVMVRYDDRPRLVTGERFYMY
ncbi:MAG: hypothetical protein K2K72_02820, partial [Duncaniella sp.]|nr:hypothetical protein [Duncaniella sp.]